MLNIVRQATPIGRYGLYILRLAVITMLVSACGIGGSRYILVTDLRVPDRTVNSNLANLSRVPSLYWVKKGDTLISIAWRYGLDYKRLATANSIPPPYMIYIGQSLKLNETQHSNDDQISQAPTIANQPDSATSVSVAVDPVNNNFAVPQSVVPQLPGKLSWQWPLLGKLVEQFGLNKGIDIAVAKGSQVRAVAAGIVVYAGDGIHGYGNLLIIKHNDIYMSAYAYNSQLLVAEGELVKAGQKIAKVGLGPEQQARLHFEIRKNGQPIDPLLVLPKR